MHNYIEKHAFLPKQIIDPCDSSTGICVVIPCYNEPNLLDSLNSLLNCTKPTCHVEVIIVINSSEHETIDTLHQNTLTIRSLTEWISNQKSEWISFFFIHANKLPHKHAGVGLARKIGMDEAVRRFQSINKNDGILVCFDADSLCSANYFVEIENHFRHTKTHACSIHFEHPIEGNTNTPSEYKAIIRYELFLRYYRQALKYAGLPYAYHTIGSSMAVRNDIYQAQGGMNKRKAGEDFYFLQKIIPLGQFSELTTTTTIPSPRVSTRVPFGTGKAVGDWIEKKTEEFFTYDFSIFLEIKKFVELIPHLYFENNDSLIMELPPSIKMFLNEQNIDKNLKEIRRNSASKLQFEKRLFLWFNAFKVLKFIHFSRDNYYQLSELHLQCKRLLEKLNINEQHKMNEYPTLLWVFRTIDKSQK